MSSRIGVDIGGTFTDLIFFNEDDGSVLVDKVPTTPAAPEIGCVDAINSAVAPDLLRSSSYFLHGTTVGLNALLERKGSVVGFLTTSGFRDVLEIRKGSREEWYNVFWVPDAPLVPRRRRIEVRERMLSSGEALEPLIAEDVIDAVKALREQGVTAIAVSFLNAYMNPAHEIEAEKLIREAGFDGAVSLSHRVSGEYRDYERSSTTVIDAYVRGRLSNYMEHIESRLRAGGFDGTCLITRSGSGSMTFTEAAERPFETIMSGPVAGVEGAAELARTLGLGDIISADVGGTSFDTALIRDGRPQLLYEGSVLGMPLQTPWVDVRSIGAGGGSIAYVDVGGLLQVGPQSAGAEPGPACYGRGGTHATVTDAAFYLGMLASGNLASGIRLDRGKSEAALKPLADRLGYDLTQTAEGIITIAVAAMANAIREITVEQGFDPREMKLLPFGGAGPMLATELARELDMREIIIPPCAGNFSALGLLTSDLLQSAALTRPMPLNDESLSQANDILEGLFKDLKSRGSAGVNGTDTQLEVALDLRYTGQEHTINVQPDADGAMITAAADDVQNRFEAAYHEAYGGILDTLIEIVSIRASVRRPLSGSMDFTGTENIATSGSADSVRAYSFIHREYSEFPVMERSQLSADKQRKGPAIIIEPTTTTYVDADCRYTVDAGGCLRINLEET